MIRESNPWGNPPMVLDLSFLKDMSSKEASSMMLKEVPYAIKNMKTSTGPLAPIFLTSFDPKCDICQHFLEFYNIGKKTSLSEFYLNVTEKSYLVRDPLVLFSPRAILGVPLCDCRTCFPRKTSSTYPPTQGRTWWTTATTTS